MTTHTASHRVLLAALGAAATFALAPVAQADHDRTGTGSDTVVTCVEAGDWGSRGLAVAVTEDDGGRLLATVYEDDTYDARILLVTGVSERSAPGRDLDIIYMGRGLQLAVASGSDAGLLTATIHGRRVRIPLVCY